MRLILGRLLLLFTVVPLVELVLLLEIGRRIGTAATVILILVTGIAGAVLAKQQGLGVLRRIRADATAGQPPGAALVDGLIILIAGALLITPGVLTDVVGFLCLIPASRRVLRAMLWAALARAVQQGRARIDVRFDTLHRPGPPPDGSPNDELPWPPRRE